MSELDGIRRDIGRLGQDLSKGLSATTVLLEQAQRQLGELSRRLDEKVKEDHHSDLARATQLAEIRTKVESLLQSVGDIPERVAKLEAGHEHVRSDITGKTDVRAIVAERDDKKEDRALERKRLAGEQRRATLQFWSGIAVVSIPGLIALVWHLLGIGGEPPAAPTPHAEHGAEHSTP